MTKIDVIEHIFYELKRIGLVKCKSDYIENWMCREKSYIRVLRYKNRYPSKFVFEKIMQKIKIYSLKLRENNNASSQRISSELEYIVSKASDNYFEV